MRLFVAMGVTGGSMWNAPSSKRRNYKMFTFVKIVYKLIVINFLWYDS